MSMFSYSQKKRRVEIEFHAVEYYSSSKRVFVASFGHSRLQAEGRSEILAA